jgi:hypothetical protein
LNGDYFLRNIQNKASAGSFNDFNGLSIVWKYISQITPASKMAHSVSDYNTFAPYFIAIPASK